MKKELYKFLAVLVLGAVVVFLSSCGGGAGSEAIADQQPLTGDVKFSSMASIPLVHGLEIGSYSLEIQNGSSREYFLKNLRIINPLSGKEDLRLGKVETSACSKILANTSCDITIKPLLNKPVSFILEADMLDEDKKIKTIRQIVRVSDKLATNGGIMLKNDIGEIASVDGKYSLVIPVLLTESFDSINVDNGSLVCHDGYTKNSSCSYILSGAINNDTLLTTKIIGYRQNRAVSINSFSTNVTKKIAANLLLSQPDDIIYRKEDPLSNRTTLTIFNNGNYTAGNIRAATTDSISIIKDNTTTCGVLLAPHAACNISVKAESQINGSDLITVNYLPSNTEEVAKTAAANVLRIILSSPLLSISRLDGSLTDASAGETKNINLLIKNDGGKKLTSLMFNLGTTSVTNNRLGFNIVSDSGCGLNGSQSLASGESCVLRVSYSVRNLDGISNDEKGIVKLGLVGKYIESDGTATSYAAESSYMYSTNLLAVAEFLGGSQTINDAGNASFPRARMNAAAAIDKDGNLWMFGGDGHLGFYNDLWKYDVKDKTWTLVSGSTSIHNQFAVYGTRGVQHPNNRPGSRTNTAAWIDKNGNFWLFGGTAFGGEGYWGIKNDLWRYNTSTNQWTWMKGSSEINSAGSYGLIEVPNDSNEPPSRGAHSTWVDKSGNLWLFGGVTLSGSGKALGDLWKYDVTTNQWTWMKGSPSIDYAGSFGTRGEPHPKNNPPAMVNSASFSDSDGNFWLFGGGVSIGSGYDLVNTLWKYNVESNVWTWVSGSNENGTPAGSYHSKGQFNSLNIVSGRVGSSGWVDKLGNIWIFSGALTNDFWKYSPSNDMWAWMGGSNLSNQPSIYPPADSPQIGGRGEHVYWSDRQGSVYIFGGYGYAEGTTAQGLLNDMWQIK